MRNSVQSVRHDLLQEAAYRRARPRPYEGGMIIPFLSNWKIQMKNNRLFLVGNVKYHTRHPDGAVVKTTAVMSHLTIRNRLLVMTQNSIYELGQPAQPNTQLDKNGLHQLNPKYYKVLQSSEDAAKDIDPYATEVADF